MYLPDQPRALAGMHRALPPRGRVAAIVLSPPPAWDRSPAKLPGSRVITSLSRTVSSALDQRAPNGAAHPCRGDSLSRATPSYSGLLAWGRLLHGGVVLVGLPRGGQAAPGRASAGPTPTRCSIGSLAHPAVCWGLSLGMRTRPGFVRVSLPAVQRLLITGPARHSRRSPSARRRTASQSRQSPSRPSHRRWSPAGATRRPPRAAR